MFAAMMNKQNKLQKLWSNWNLFGCFPYSARYEHLSDAQRLMGAFFGHAILRG